MQKWEYLFVSCGLVSNQWVPNFVGGQELPDWKKGPSICQVANQLGEQGWELVNLATTPNLPTSESYRLVFKRPKE